MSSSNQLLANLEFSLADRFYKLACKPGLKLFRHLTRGLMHHAAGLGHQRTLLVFGERLMSQGITERERMLGAEYLVRAAQQGNAEAQWLAGSIYEKGVAPFVQNDAHAVTWYARAAGQGHSKACRRLARAYQQGELSLPANSEKACYWNQAA
ncbi:tetratricopeptide repeat protein [Marinospirillum alkaliphilum]|uniref:Sel1 repeat-containing protein n=1 Tax=Marinospirillum alkaliphilum DSM 21637 TaxID=1122209 RepID=A0A1K1VVB2_9GAMM|nr:SEL1-like repeat protein [Marinospirillum alkaliphilum]SFX29032.1 Sel1 repeat-containing protein [Marinospirillum alkaliphilum DSM 21637]